MFTHTLINWTLTLKHVQRIIGNENIRIGASIDTWQDGYKQGNAPSVHKQQFRKLS